MRHLQMQGSFQKGLHASHQLELWDVFIIISFIIFIISTGWCIKNGPKSLQ